MTYFLFAAGGVLLGFMLCALYVSPRIVQMANSASADRIARTKADKANGVLRRELAELRAQYEPTRDHGYGRSNG